MENKITIPDECFEWHLGESMTAKEIEMENLKNDK